MQIIYQGVEKCKEMKKTKEIRKECEKRRRHIEIG
jgi:hypothetical protein